MQGIIVGCDANQEWLLPWWWKHYSACNDYPIVFIDFGMTAKGIAYCQQRGTCLSLNKVPFVEKIVRSRKKRALWEQRYSAAIWTHRVIYFKKPFALLQTPFACSLWIDLDCQVLKSLEPLFNCLWLGADIALCRESEEIQDLHRKKGLIRIKEVNYNCGVIAFRKDASILHRWVQEIEQRNDRYAFEQHALAKALLLDQTPVFELSPIFNWSMAQGSNDHAYIQHFHGGLLKSLIPRTEL